MRIAFKLNVLTVLCGTLLLGVQAGAYADPVPSPYPPSSSAQSTIAPPVSQASTAAAIPAATTTKTTVTASLSAPAAAPAMVAPPPAPPPALLPPLPVAAESKSAGGINALENKVPDSVKDILKHLDKTSEDVTLDDLNSARQAVAKIEALIDIEKHLVELDKVRDEREKKNSFAGAINASALQPPPSSQMSMSSSPASMPIVPVQRALDVSRIEGRNGHYSAVIKLSDSNTKMLQVGDELTDGSKVVKITATEVVLERGQKTQTLHVKNVDMVSSGSF
jgi:type IV pilus biogenesis protein PilP